MKKLFTFALIAVLLASGLILSCSNASGSSANGATGTESGTSETTEQATGPDDGNGIVEEIKALKESRVIKASGRFSARLLREINTALKQLSRLNKDIKVVLDLSEVTGLTELESALENSSCSFCECKNLVEVILPNTIKTIGAFSFCDCSKLESVTIPASVTSIAEGAFSGCVALEEMSLPIMNGVLSNSSKTYYPFGYIFGETPYDGAVATEQEYYMAHYENNVFIGGQVLKSTYYLPPFLKRIKITGSWINDGFFYNCSQITMITICGGEEGIGANAFFNCAGLTRVMIPNIANGIGYCAFAGCTELTSVTMPDSVTEIGAHAFSDCTSLASVTISNGVTSIGFQAFEGCTELTSVTMPDSVTEIGMQAFYGCTSLTSVTFSDTSRWYYGGYHNYTDGTAIDSATLADSATAATYLKDTYSDKYWYKL